jgi:hypothetical protein
VSITVNGCSCQVASAWRNPLAFHHTGSRLARTASQSAHTTGMTGAQQPGVTDATKTKIICSNAGLVFAAPTRDITRAVLLTVKVGSATINAPRCAWTLTDGIFDTKVAWSSQGAVTYGRKDRYSRIAATNKGASSRTRKGKVAKADI